MESREPNRRTGLMVSSHSASADHNPLLAFAESETEDVAKVEATVKHLAETASEQFRDGAEAF